MMIEIRCGGCGILFGIDEGVHASLKRTGRDFRCPNGCVRCFPTGPDSRDRKIANLESILEDTRESRDRHYAQGSETLVALRACPLRCGWRSRKQTRRWNADDDAFERGLIRIQFDVIEHLSDAHGLELPAETELWIAEVAA